MLLAECLQNIEQSVWEVPHRRCEHLVCSISSRLTLRAYSVQETTRMDCDTMKKTSNISGYDFRSLFSRVKATFPVRAISFMPMGLNSSIIALTLSSSPVTSIV